MTDAPGSPPEPARWQAFLAEMKRRKVLRAAAVYGGAAFVVLQAADILAEGLRLPPAFLGILSVVAIAAFPLVLFLAWTFEVTPAGVRRTAPAARGELAEIADEPRGRRWLAALLALAGTGLLLAGGWTVLRSTEERGGVDTAVPAPSTDRSRIAVLPFTNVSGDEENERFALGVHNDIHTRLTRLAELRVISRRSVMEYRDADRDLAEVARELGVGTVLTGSAQRAGGALRISVELVDPVSSESLWAESYDREWTVEGLLEVQTDIAERVARSLQVALSQAERRSLAASPTRDPDAYDHYLAAIEAFDRGFEAVPTLVAIERAQRAVDIDPQFAAAWAMLGVAHLYIYWDGHDRTPERRTLGEAAIGRALEIDPDLPEVRAALGRLHYWGYLDYERALEVLTALEREAPSTRYVLDGIASVKRRQGKLEESVEYFLRAYELDPLHATWGSEAGLTLYLLRRYDEALPLIETTVIRDPGGGFAYAAVARTLVARDGDVAAARRYLERGERLSADSPFLDYERVLVEIFDRRYDIALSLLERSEREALGELQFRWYPPSLVRGRVHAFRGDTAASRAAYREAMEVLEAERARLPSDERISGALALAYAGLGLESRAREEIARAVDLMPVEREYWRGIHRLEERARVLARLGDAGAAIEQLEWLLARPGEVARTLLRLDPEWDALRGDSRFHALVAEPDGEPARPSAGS